MLLTELRMLESIVLGPSVFSPRLDESEEEKKKRKGFMIAFMVPESMENLVAKAGGWEGPEPTWDEPLHYTLSYVLNVDGAFEKAVNAAKVAAREFPPFEIMATKAGFFLPEGKAAVHYVGGASSYLESFVGKLRELLDQEGLEHDVDFPIYTPHCTLEYVDDLSYAELLKRSQLALSEQPIRFIPTLAVVDDDRKEVIPWTVEPDMIGMAQWGSSFMGLPVLQDLHSIVVEGIPAKPGGSALHKHQVAAVYKSLKSKGETPKKAAIGAFKISAASLKSGGYQARGSTGKLTGSGSVRSKSHNAEPASVKARKDAEYQSVKKIATT